MKTHIYIYLHTYTHVYIRNEQIFCLYVANYSINKILINYTILDKDKFIQLQNVCYKILLSVSICILAGDWLTNNYLTIMPKDTN